MILKEIKNTYVRNENTAPFFFEGFSYAKNLLIDLRKQKQASQQLANQNLKDQKQQCEEIASEIQYHQESSKQQNISPKQQLKQTIRSTIKTYKQQLNKIGIQLEQKYTQIETYEIIFDNLSQCYSANMDKVSKNNKLKKQSRRLGQQAVQIDKKIAKTKEDIYKIQDQENAVMEYIKNSAQDYIRQILAYNKQYEHIDVPEILPKMSSSGQNKEIKEDQSEDSDYQQEIKINFEKMKKNKQDKNKKKQDKNKLQRKFEDDGDVLNRYYQSQFHDI